MGNNIKTVESMTKKDFNDVPQRKRGENIGVFNSLIILPGTKKDMHDSGFRSMDFVAVRRVLVGGETETGALTVFRKADCCVFGQIDLTWFVVRRYLLFLFIRYRKKESN